MVSQAIAEGDVRRINYFVAQKYVEALKAMADSPNQKMLLMPMEAAGMIGSLAGIAELAKEALPSRASRRGAPGATPGRRAAHATLTRDPQRIRDMRHGKSVDNYGWWLLALVLIGAEMIAPGYFLLWIGIAAGRDGRGHAARARRCLRSRRRRVRRCSPSSRARSTGSSSGRSPSSATTSRC